MRRFSALFTLVLALGLAAPQAQAAPRLVLLIVVDQMTADQLGRLGPSFKGAVRTFLDSGAVFTEAHHRHIPTVTAVGHAAIITGRMPGIHGIVANEWWDRTSRKPLTAHSDSVYGIGPEQLLSYTLGDRLKARFPGSIVVAASLKEKAAVMLAGKKGDAALWLDENRGGFATSPYYGSQRPWLASFNESLHGPGGLLAGMKRERDFEKLWLSPDSHRLLEDLARGLLSEYPLGRDGQPDLLALSFSGTDAVGHTRGPDSREVEENLLALDAALGRLLSAVLAIVPRDELVVLFTSDHGVSPVPESRVGRGLGLHRVDPRKFETQVENALQLIYPAPQGRLVEHLKIPHLYLNRPLIESRGFDWPVLLRDATRSIQSIEGVAEVYTSEKLSSTEDVRVSSSPYAHAYRASFHPSRSGDLLIRTKEDFLFSREETSHSTPYRHDTHVPLILWGAGIRSGAFPAPVRTTDAAPTLAVLLGVELPPDNDSRVLSEALQGTAPRVP